MKFNCIEGSLQSFFYKYGGFVAQHPLPFLFIPLIVTGVLSSGLFFMTVETNTENLYSPINSPSKLSRDFVQEVYSEFNNSLRPHHSTSLSQYVAIIVQPKTGNNVLVRSVIDECIRLDAFVKSVSVEIDDEIYTFSDLCLKWKGRCNTASQLLAEISFDTSERLTRPVTYPVWVSPDGRPLLIAPELSGVMLKNDSNEIVEVELLSISYLARQDEDADEIVFSWQKKMHEQLQNNFESKVIDIHAVSVALLSSDLDKAANTAVLLVGLGFALAIFFAVISTLTSDNVRSKPWLATLGSVSTGLAMTSGFGFLAHVGVPYTHIVGVVPFLVLGIGLDDMFLMVAAWRQTDINNLTKDRMSEAFSHAAISITITSITDVLAFGVGAFTNLYSVTLFCAYAGVSSLFDYIYQITFFAACLALTGYHEENNRHAFTCRKVLSKREAPSKIYSIFCAGGNYSSGSSEPITNADHDDQDHVTMRFFRQVFGPLITHPISVVITVFVYIAYLGIAIWGIVNIEKGLQLSLLTPPESESSVALKLHQEHFSKYGQAVSVVVTEDLDYSNTDTQDMINHALEELENSDYFWDSQYTISWLKQYQQYLKIRNVALGRHLSEIISEELFILILKEEFLRFPGNEQFIPDIVFDNDTNSIISSRFHVLIKNANTTIRERGMFSKAWDVVRKSELPLVVQSSIFNNFDQFTQIIPSTLQGLGTALAVMFIISLIMIPHPLCSIIITASLVSIVIGLLGFMSLWDVHLDFFSLIALISCVGFSVDYVAHVSYAYVSAHGTSPRERAIYALYAVGMPITQAAVSTIFACVPLVFIDAYIFQTLFKAFFMVSVIGALHGLVFVPVFLMLLIRQK